jgi:hypothetical protein
MERPRVGKVERKLIGTTYRLLQRLNPLVHYYEKKISDEIGNYNGGINFDDQMHSIYSDGDSTPEHIFNVSSRRGIETFAITDHDTTEHWDSCERAEKIYPNSVNIPAIEVYSKEGDILAYFPSYKCKDLESVKALTKGRRLDVEKVIDMIHDAGGVAVAAHPDKTRGVGLKEMILLSKSKIDGIEEINTEAGTHEYRPLGECLGIASTAGSDAHSKINIGSAFTIIPKDCYESSLEEGKLNKDRFRRNFIECVKEERKRIKEGLEPELRPILAVRSGFEQNLGKTTYANPFSTALKVVEYFLDKDKKVAKRLEACLEKD